MLIDIIEPILDNISVINGSPYSNMALKNLISQINSISLKDSEITTHITKISLRQQVPRCSLLTSSSFVPDHIRDYIEKESKFYATHTYSYKGREFKIIMVFDNNEVERKKGIVADMFKWLSMIVNVGELSKNCGKKTKVYCYLTPFKKELPHKSNTILSYDNANSAVTTSCSEINEICIFREEEMFKVFIHETFHAFNLDFSLNIRDSHVKQMKQMFNIRSDFKIYETYSETWAEIMNVLFLSGSVNIANKMLHAEVAFSLLQMNKVLTYMGLDYLDLIEKNAFHKYREETNVFCYYVLKALVLFYWSDFIEFCGGSIKFTREIGDFIEFIRKKHKEQDFIDAANMNVPATKTMRMTLWEN